MYMHCPKMSGLCMHCLKISGSVPPHTLPDNVSSVHTLPENVWEGTSAYTARQCQQFTYTARKCLGGYLRIHCPKTFGSVPPHTLPNVFGQCMRRYTPRHFRAHTLQDLRIHYKTCKSLAGAVMVSQLVGAVACSSRGCSFSAYTAQKCLVVYFCSENVWSCTSAYTARQAREEQGRSWASQFVGAITSSSTGRMFSAYTKKNQIIQNRIKRKSKNIYLPCQTFSRHTGTETCLSIRVSLSSSVCLSVCLSACLSVCVSVCVCFCCVWYWSCYAG